MEILSGMCFFIWLIPFLKSDAFQCLEKCFGQIIVIVSAYCFGSIVLTSAPDGRAEYLGDNEK